MADPYSRQQAAWKESRKNTALRAQQDRREREAAAHLAANPPSKAYKHPAKSTSAEAAASSRARLNQTLLSDSATGGLRSKLAPGPTNQGGAPKAGQATKTAAQQAASAKLSTKPKKAASRSRRQSVSKGKSVSTAATKTAATKTPRKPRAPKAK